MSTRAFTPPLSIRSGEDIGVCDRIEISGRTGTGPDLKPRKVNRIRPDFYRIFKTLTLNLQVTNINMAASILRYELKGKAKTRPDIFRYVLGPCAHSCPFEASNQTWGQKPKSTPKGQEIKL